MGYQTNFSLQVDLMVGGKIAQLVDREPLAAVINNLLETSEEARYALDEDGEGTGEGSKWYEHQAEMREFSKLHPSVLFTLHGEGEENGDIWDEYYLNGKMQVAKAKMQIAPFDPKLLT